MRLVVGAIVATAMYALVPAQRPQFPFPTEVTPHMEVYSKVDPPSAFVEFCARTPSQCETAADQPEWAITPDRMAELAAVNVAVNHEIEPATDRGLYGIADYWTIPTTKGDCEDYALLKRQRLIELGWPPSVLLIAVVFHNEEGHAVLIAVTWVGDLVLDNKVDDLRLWHQTPYAFVSRQSSANPREWHSLLPHADHWGGE